MNRQAKRLMAKQEKARARPKAPAARRPLPAEAQKKKRVGARQFLKEVRVELKKVDWPSRKELTSYTLVVLFTVIIMAGFVAGFDLLFSKAVLKLFGN